MSKRGEKLSEMPTPQKAAEVRRLRAEGMTWDEIKALVAEEIETPAPTAELAHLVRERDGSLG